jgi:hypothetical protein
VEEKKTKKKSTDNRERSILIINLLPTSSRNPRGGVTNGAFVIIVICGKHIMNLIRTRGLAMCVLECPFEVLEDTDYVLAEKEASENHMKLVRMASKDSKSSLARGRTTKRSASDLLAARANAASLHRAPSSLGQNTRLESLWHFFFLPNFAALR